MLGERWTNIVSRDVTLQFIRFSAVGGSSVVVYFIALAILRNFIDNTILLTFLCYLLSAIYNFILQSTFTFKARDIRGGTVARFGVMHGAAMAANSAAMYLLVDIFLLPLYGAQFLVTACITVAVFSASKYWVFRA